MTKLDTNQGLAVAIAIVVVFSTVAMAFFVAVESDAAADNTISEKTEANTKALNAFRVSDSVNGDGAEAGIGDTIVVHYVGQLQDGTTFDTSTNNNLPFVTSLGKGQVITGWDLGLIGMREGGTRRLVIPAELGYGEREIADSTGKVIIPANSTLIFDVVLLQVESSI